jgi:hypothetical protein
MFRAMSKTFTFEEAAETSTFHDWIRQLVQDL